MRVPPAALRDLLLYSICCSHHNSLQYNLFSPARQSSCQSRGRNAIIENGNKERTDCYGNEKNHKLYHRPYPARSRTLCITKDMAGDAVITTFDIRMTSPNDEPVMNTAEVHTIEHLGATFLRNHETFSDKVLYFGPMGCRTGFYLLLTGDYSSADIVPLMKEMFSFIASYEGEVPGASDRDCGNYLDMNLPMARWLASRYLRDVLTDIREDQLNYPE